MKRLLAGPVTFALLASHALAEPASNRTIGLALTDVRYAFYESNDTGKEECPDGLQPGEPAQARAQKDYINTMMNYGGSYENRGPNGEIGNTSPLTVVDPIPFRDYKPPRNVGLNLDGTSDGAATAKTCKHEKFVTADGDKVDNQISRVIGCILGYRTSGLMTEFQSGEIINSSINRHLIEITGVDDETNDPAVDVTIYKGKDVVIRSAAGDKFVPYQSQRIDELFPGYTFKTTGKIVAGVLITDPIPDARMPIRYGASTVDRILKNLTLRLELSPDGAKGQLGGYEDITSWYNLHSKKVLSGLGRYSSASMYKAALRYADGDPDPATGQCRALSMALKVTAVRAIIVHGSRGRQRIVKDEDYTRMAKAQE